MPTYSPNRLIVFTRYPEPGKTKTRLISALGPKGAAALQQQMTEDTISTAKRFALETGAELEVRYESGGHALMRNWLGQDLPFCRQGPGDLGEKISRAFAEAFTDGCQRVMIIGSDCPDLSAETLAAGITALADYNLVLGPASDGGYYLVGLAAPCPQLFKNRSWGNERLLAETISVAEREAMNFYLLEELNDVDRPEDLTDLSDHSDPE